MKSVCTKLTNLVYPAFILLMLFSVSSCVDTRKAVYFNNLPEGTVNGNTIIPEGLIQKNDLLGVSITSPVPEAFAPFNSGNSEYFVNADSTIRLPVIGSIRAVGLTKDQLKDTILRTLRVRKLLVDPIVNVRFLTFRVTILGEVNGPKVISVPNEKISLLEAIGFAGDITFYGRKDNVLVIREENGKRVVKRIDMNSNDLFNSPYYYLKSNDIVYVEPNKAKLASQNKTKDWVFGILGVASIVIGIATFFKN
jgi:polysaccharide export outer membrane protein